MLISKSPLLKRQGTFKVLSQLWARPPTDADMPWLNHHECSWEFIASITNQLCNRFRQFSACVPWISYQDHTCRIRLLSFALPRGAQPVRATPASAASNEWDLTTPTGWNTLHNLTAQQLTDFLTNNNERIIDLEVVQGAEVRFSAVTVKNEGEYAKTSWWYPDLSLLEVMILLSTNQARLIDVEVYVTYAGELEDVHYAVVMVPNTGADQKEWAWLPLVDADGISQYLNDNNNYRIIDLEQFESSGSRYYAAILISNAGDDFRNWGYLINVTWPEIEPYLANGRLLDLLHEGEDRFSVVIQNCPCSGWWVYFGTALADVTARAAQEGARIIDLEIYTDDSLPSPTTIYAGIMIDNLNSESRRIANILASVPEVREYGLYLKKVGGSELANLQADFVHEPLSSIKVLPHFYAMRQVQETDGRVNLGTPIRTYLSSGLPDENCYLPSNNPVVFQPLGEMLSDMMVPSSNTAWAATVNHFGKQEIQDYVTDVLQMAHTEIRRVGCTNVYNRWTLRDAGKLYESVANGSQLNGAARIDFYNIMAQKWVEVDMLIDEEVPAGMSHNDRNLFKSLVQVPHKDGSWAVDASGEIKEESAFTRIGALRLPQCAGPFRVTGSYVYGVFIAASKAMESAINTASLEAATELMRAIIRDSLSQWDDCAPLDIGDVDSLGGLLHSDDGRLSVSLPQGAVSGPVNLFYTDQVDPNLLLPANLADLFRFSLDAVDPSGSAVTTFNAPLTLEVSYQDSDLAQTGGSEDSLALAVFDERLERWVLLPSTLDPANNRVTAQVEHLSNFALVASVTFFNIFVPMISK